MLGVALATLASRQGYKEVDSVPFSKGNQGFLRHYLIPPHRWRAREVKKWENTFRAALLWGEEASIGQEVPLMSLRRQACLIAPLKTAST